MTLECSYCERDLRMGHAPDCERMIPLDKRSGERLLRKDEALPCPFCGKMPTIQKWHGSGPRTRMVSCSNDSCGAHPSVIGNTSSIALAIWNMRGGMQVLLSQLK